MYRLAMGSAFLVLMTTGCVSTTQVNEGFRRIDRAWQLEYQKTEDAFRYRVVDAPYDAVYVQVKKAFLNLSMPIQREDFTKGIIIVENEAPLPLTDEEWEQVVEVENPRVREIGGWMFDMGGDPSVYIVTVTASLRAVGEKTFVLLDYRLDCPKYRRMGFAPSQYAPPLAVQLGATKFWEALQSNLNRADLPSPRKRQGDELYAASHTEDGVALGDSFSAQRRSNAQTFLGKKLASNN